jgi:hypothetical protein
VISLDARSFDLARGVFFGYELGVESATERSQAEINRLTAALKVCELALHSRSVVRDDADGTLIHAAQQASCAYETSWQPGEQERDDAGLTDG